MDYTATILMTQFVTPDTKRFVVTRPQGFQWTPGQGVEIVINQPDWKTQEGHPFTPTSRVKDRVLEFTIKRYPDHHGVTDHLHTLEPGAELLLSAPFGTINYKGKGTFIAAGAGVTPFLAIIRDLETRGELEGNRMLYSNKRPADIICEKELRYYFGDNLICTCTRGPFPGYLDHRIDRTLLEERVRDFDQHFYVCGPEKFVEDINGILTDLGAQPDALVFEQ